MVYERKFNFRTGLQRFNQIKSDLEFYVKECWKSHGMYYIVPFGIGQLFFVDCKADDGIIVIDENSPKFELENVCNYRINISTSSEVLDNIMSKDIEKILGNNNVEKIVR